MHVDGTSVYILKVGDQRFTVAAKTFDAAPRVRMRRPSSAAGATISPRPPRTAAPRRVSWVATQPDSGRSILTDVCMPRSPDSRRSRKPASVAMSCASP
jgi:hypothetical protein